MILEGQCKQPPSLVDLCIRTAIDNVRYLGDVGETDSQLLDRILPHCTLDQLTHVEDCTEGRDLSPITNKLWKRFYEKHFGAKNMNLVIERMKKNRVTFKWRQLYEAKLKDMQKTENEAVDRLRQLYKKEDERKQSRQIQFCSKVPPGNKRGFWGSGPGYNLSNVKSKIMKKAKLDLLKSQEMKNLAAMKKKAVQKSFSIAPPKRGSFSGKNAPSTSRITPLKREKMM